MMFQVGQEVEWETVSGAGRQTRRGKVRKVIKPGESIKAAFNAMGPGFRKEFGGGDKRQETAFLVEVPPWPGRSQPILYCPPVTRLRAVGNTPAKPTEPPAGASEGDAGEEDRAEADEALGEKPGDEEE